MPTKRSAEACALLRDFETNEWKKAWSLALIAVRSAMCPWVRLCFFVHGLAHAGMSRVISRTTKMTNKPVMVHEDRLGGKASRHTCTIHGVNNNASRKIEPLTKHTGYHEQYNSKDNDRPEKLIVPVKRRLLTLITVQVKGGTELAAA